MKNSSILVLGTAVALFAGSSAFADTVLISDTMSGASGQNLGPSGRNGNVGVNNPVYTNLHSPDVNLTGNPYTYDVSYNTNPVTTTGTGGVGIPASAASIPATAGGIAAINIASSSSNSNYTKPTTMTISAALEPNDITTQNTFDKEGLGFFTAPSPAQVFLNFLGLALSSDGTVTLIGFGPSNFNTTVDVSQAYTLDGGVFDPLIFHTLSYSINTTTGAIVSASLTDVYGTETYNFASLLAADDISNNFFTDAQTTYAGFYARSDTAGTAYIDNFSLTTAPEPSSVALMLAGLAGLVWFGRRRTIARNS